MTLTSPTYYQHPTLGNLSDYVQHMPYFQGAAFKYVARAGKKPGVPASDDLAKAKNCLNRIIEEKHMLVYKPGDELQRLLDAIVHCQKTGNELEQTRLDILYDIYCGDIERFVYSDPISRLIELIERQEQALEKPEQEKSE